MNCIINPDNVVCQLIFLSMKNEQENMLYFKRKISVKITLDGWYEISTLIRIKVNIPKIETKLYVSCMLNAVYKAQPIKIMIFNILKNIIDIFYLTYHNKTKIFILTMVESSLILDFFL
jgi:hypothetical protein